MQAGANSKSHIIHHPPKESYHARPPSDAYTSEKRGNHHSNRASVEVLQARKEAVEHSRRSTDEDNKYYQQSPMRRPSRSRDQSSGYSSISDKHTNKENASRDSVSHIGESREKKEEKEKIHNLISDVKNVLYPVKKSKAKQDSYCSDDDFEEESDKRVYAK